MKHRRRQSRSIGGGSVPYSTLHRGSPHAAGLTSPPAVGSPSVPVVGSGSVSLPFARRAGPRTVLMLSHAAMSSASSAHSSRFGRPLTCSLPFLIAIRHPRPAASSYVATYALPSSGWLADRERRRASLLLPDARHTAAMTDMG